MYKYSSLRRNKLSKFLSCHTIYFNNQLINGNIEYYNIISTLYNTIISDKCKFYLHNYSKIKLTDCVVALLTIVVAIIAVVVAVIMT
ncbi:hypothetical protein V1478_011221 [Vespula squamosa]|uniref:Uncharacterized protein n=1 Tax=Vespula squamosa TaxID=30214 RepID=A0ABD2ADV5_VESSQ